MDGFVAMLTGVSNFPLTATTPLRSRLQHPPAAHPNLTAGEKITMRGDKSARIDGSTAIFESLRVVTAVAASFMPC
jgi:hypothetical protein